MFLKTLKHDFLNSYKEFGFLYITLLAVALIGAFSLQLQNFVTVIFMFFLGLSVGGILLATFIYVLRFLDRRLFKQGAYFNLTLPVSIETTLLSKLLTAMFWGLMTSLMTLLAMGLFAIMLAVLNDVPLETVFNGVKEIIQSLNLKNIVLVLLHSTTGYLGFISLVLVVMTIVNTSWFKKPNYFISFILFCVIGFIESSLNNFIFRQLNTQLTPISEISVGVEGLFANINLNTQHILIEVFVTLVLAIVYFLVTRYLFKNKLEI